MAPKLAAGIYARARAACVLHVPVLRRCRCTWWTSSGPPCTDQARVPVLGLMRTHARVRRVPLLLAAVILLLAATIDGIRPSPDDDVKPAQRTEGEAGSNDAAARKGFLQEEVYATGSSLPDCAHACGPCKPCNRVMVSFKCSIAEPCPMVYRCMCKGKCYPVPSS